MRRFCAGLILILCLPDGTIAQDAGRPDGRPLPTDLPARRTTDLMLSDFHAADPFILPYAPDETYYLFTSGSGGEGRSGVVAYTSKDLRVWNGPRVVFAAPGGTWANPYDGAEAPEVHEYRGRFYLLVTLHNRDAVFAEPPEVWRANHRQGAVIAESETPAGPYQLLRTDGPHPPQDFMTTDGTLHVDADGKPWLVYCHAWVQVIDGTFEAVQLSADLSGTVEDPIYLFKASDGPWFSRPHRVTRDERLYVSDGAQLFRTREGRLLMLWSTYTRDMGYIQTVARSKSGELPGPWEQLDPLVTGDSGHGMLFHTFQGQLMLVLQQPVGLDARARLYEMEDAGDRLRVVRRREDLDTRAQPAPRRGGRSRRRGSLPRTP